MFLPFLLAGALAPPAHPIAAQPYPADPFAGKAMIVATDNTGTWVRAAVMPGTPLRKRIDAALARALVWPKDLRLSRCLYHRDVLLSTPKGDYELGICFGCNIANWAPKGTSVQLRSNSTIGFVRDGRDELIYLFREATGVEKIPLNPAKNPAPRGGG